MVQDGVWGKGEKRGPTFPRPHVLASLAWTRLGPEVAA